MSAILGGQRTMLGGSYLFISFPQESVLLKVFFQAQHVTMIFNKNTVEYWLSMFKVDYSNTAVRSVKIDANLLRFLTELIFDVS